MAARSVVNQKHGHHTRPVTPSQYYPVLCSADASMSQLLSDRPICNARMSHTAPSGAADAYARVPTSALPHRHGSREGHPNSKGNVGLYARLLNPLQSHHDTRLQVKTSTKTAARTRGGLRTHCAMGAPVRQVHGGHKVSRAGACDLQAQPTAARHVALREMSGIVTSCVPPACCCPAVA